MFGLICGRCRNIGAVPRIPESSKSPSPLQFAQLSLTTERPLSFGLKHREDLPPQPNLPRGDTRCAAVFSTSHPRCAAPQPSARP
jgi:hypothetical protein